MNAVTLLWASIAAVALALTVVCGLLWLIERRDHSSLMLCVVGIAAASSSYIELGLMRSMTAAEYGEWLRWYHLPVFFGLVGLVLFVDHYLRTGRLWLMRAFIVSQVLVAVVDFTTTPNANFLPSELLHISFLGEQVSVIGRAVFRPWQWFALGSLGLLVYYLLDAVVHRWRQGDEESRRKALTIGIGTTLPMAFNLVLTQMIVFGVIHAPISNIPWFLGALSTMAYELARDVVLGRRARLDLVELRDRLAQLDRVSTLSQLSSTLAHELLQPLTAIATNVETALAMHESDNLGHADLRAILSDIADANGRAAALIERMRRLFKRQSIEMQPLGVEEILRDVVSLVHGQVVSRNIALDIRIRPGLPRILGDRVHVSQVVLNLLMNSIEAVQALPIDARRIILEARRSAAEAGVEFTIRDTGPGIPDGKLNEIFRPFFTTKIDGMGVGLALSRTIVEALGGRLWLEPRSPDEDGTTFRFTLRGIH
jgi:signal transduction histidine kinase